MPVVAESGPMLFDAQQPTPTPAPETPPPTYEFKPKPTTPSDFVVKHNQFMQALSMLTCFKREDLPQFTDQEFDDHIAIAIADQYVTQTYDQYCTMQGVYNLSQVLKRYRE